MLHLHLCRIGGRSRTHKVPGCVHAHAHCHKGVACTGGVGACRLDAPCHGGLHIALPDGSVGQHCALVPHIDELLALLVVADACHAHGDDLHTTQLIPVCIQHIAHVLCQLQALGGQCGDPLTVHGHLPDGSLQCAEEFVKVLVVDIVDVHMLRIPGHSLAEELQRIGDLDGVAAVAPYKQLCVVEIVKVLQCIPGAELDALDLLQVDKVHLLGSGGLPAEFDPAEGFLDGVLQLPVEHGGGGRQVYFIVARLGRVVNDLAAVHQQHHLVDSHMDHGAVGNNIFRPLLVAAALIAHLHPSGADCGCCHIVRLYDLQPGIRQAAGYGTCDCFQNAHILTSDFIVLGSTLHAAW